MPANPHARTPARPSRADLHSGMESGRGGIRDVYLGLIRPESRAISEPTVKTHINNLFAKIQVTTRAQAVAHAFLHGLAPDRASAGRPVQQRLLVELGQL